MGQKSNEVIIAVEELYGPSDLSWLVAATDAAQLFTEDTQCETRPK